MISKQGRLATKLLIVKQGKLCLSLPHVGYSVCAKELVLRDVRPTWTSSVHCG